MYWILSFLSHPSLVSNSSKNSELYNLKQSLLRSVPATVHYAYCLVSQQGASATAVRERNRKAGLVLFLSFLAEKLPCVDLHLAKPAVRLPRPSLYNSLFLSGMVTALLLLGSGSFHLLRGSLYPSFI